MAYATRKTPSPTFLPVFDWPTAFAESLVQGQRVQLEALISWQQSVAAFHQELWDAWVSRWAGGVPIDG